MIYLISTIMLLSILFTKIYFVFIGNGGIPGIFEYISIAILIIIIITGTLQYFKSLVKIKFEKPKFGKSVIPIALLIFISLFVLTSFFINLNKKGVLWDSVALYDARARFLTQGINFVQMVDISKYDPQNSYYYVLYPPYTSILHFFWYSLKIPAPVSVMYTIWLAFLAITVFSVTKKRLGLFGSTLLTFLTVSNGVIFSSSLAEYTNLPFTLQMFLGVLLLYEYLDDGVKWKLFYGVGLIITTMWIRFLEPIWAGVTIALFIAMFLKKKSSKELLYTLLMCVYGVFEYLSWQSFVSSFGQTTKIVSFSWLAILEPIVGVFTGSMVTILIFFIKSWGMVLAVYVFVILLAFINRKKMSLLQMFLLISILIYFSGLYFVSFQSVWWNSLGDSLVRSSTFMIPISGYLVLEYLHDKKN